MTRWLFPALVACSSAPVTPVIAPVPDALAQAHQAWLDEDLHALTQAVHEVLEADPAPHVVDNAVALLDEAFRHHETLPTGQAPLPDGIGFMSLNHIHRQGADGHRYRLMVHALSDRPGRVTELSLEGPGIHADRTTATWNATPNAHGEEVELELMDQPQPAPHGLYTIAFTVDGTRHTRWTILGDDVASEVPSIVAPASGAVVQTATPEIRFEAMATPEGTGHERIGYGIWVAHRPDFRKAWSIWSTASDPVTIDTPLDNGGYSLIVSRREAHSLMPIGLGRIARRHQPFEVRVP